MRNLAQYQQIHAAGSYGTSDNAQAVAQYFREGVATLLDYGSGQSCLAADLADLLELDFAVAYDPAVSGRDSKPEGVFDAVTCTDVLEHVPEDELDATLADIRAYSGLALFFISTRKANTHLPNGENAHCTVEPAEWWRDRLLAHYGDVAVLSVGRTACRMLASA